MDEKEKALRRILREQETLFQQIEDAERASRAEAKRQELDALIWQSSLSQSEQLKRLEGILGLYETLSKYGRSVHHLSTVESESWAIDRLINALRKPG